MWARLRASLRSLFVGLPADSTMTPQDMRTEVGGSGTRCTKGMKRTPGTQREGRRMVDSTVELLEGCLICRYR